MHDFRSYIFAARIGSDSRPTCLAFFGGFGGNVRWSSWAHWKARSALPVSVDWTFFARCYGWGATR